MPYRPIGRPTVQSPKVERLICKLERHYLMPAHAMLRLPVPNYRLLDPCHFALAHLLLAAIAGVSTTLYSRTGGNGYRFKQVLIDYYPFSFESGNTLSPQQAADTLWSVFRNPLAHDLGYDLETKAKTPEVKVFRVLRKSKTRGLTEKEIEALEITSSRPTLEPTLSIRSDATVLRIDALYWGVRQMLENLLADVSRVQAAERLLPQI